MTSGWRDSCGGFRTYEAIAGALHAHGIRVLFGVLGDDTVLLAHAARALGIAYAGARHEAVAVGMADGHAWVTGSPAVCLLTRGPGLLNGLGALRTAVRGGARLAVISGDVPSGATSDLDRKWLDVETVAGAIGVAVVRAPDAASVVASLRDVLASASSGVPAMLAVPADVLVGSADRYHERSFCELVAPTGAGPAQPAALALSQAAEAIAESELPLILAGWGSHIAGARDALVALAEQSGALLGTTLKAKDFFRGHPRNIGVVGGFTPPSAARALSWVDCIVAFGASLNSDTVTTGNLFEVAKLVHVDCDSLSTGRYTRVDVAVVGDCADVAQALLELLPRRAGSVAAPPPGDAPPAQRGGQLDPRTVAAALDAGLPPDRTLVFDGGRFLRAAATILHVQSPDRFRFTLDAGSVGHGLGVAIGVALADRSRRTVLLTGDGGLSMGLGDLATVRELDVPITIVVFNDCGYGAERIVLAKHGVESDIASLAPVDFAAVARAHGLHTALVDDEASLVALASQLVSTTGPGWSTAGWTRTSPCR